MKKAFREKGFTLIELVIVIMVLGILAAIAIPKFIDLSDDATAAAKKGMSGAVKSSLAIATADLKRVPTNTELASYVTGDGVSAAPSGINVLIDDTVHTVLTYTDAHCTTAITSTSDSVLCVGEIP